VVANCFRWKLCDTSDFDRLNYKWEEPSVQLIEEIRATTARLGQVRSNTNNSRHERIYRISSDDLFVNRDDRPWSMLCNLALLRVTLNEFQ